MKLKVSLFVWLGLCQIAAIGCTSGRTDQPSAGEGDASGTQHEAEPTSVVPASQNTTEALGVVAWQVYEQQNHAVIRGLRANQEVGAVATIDGMVDAQGRFSGVSLETSYPEAGRLVIDRSGKVTANSLSAGSKVFSAISNDFKAQMASGEVDKWSFHCSILLATVVASCGTAAIACPETLCIDLVVAAPACLYEYENYICECGSGC